MELEFSQQIFEKNYHFLKKPQILNWMEINPVGAE